MPITEEAEQGKQKVEAVNGAESTPLKDAESSTISKIIQLTGDHGNYIFGYIQHLT